MLEHVNGKELLPDPSSLTLRSVANAEGGWVVEACAPAAAAVCPDCGVQSTARHSRCMRHLKDLPLQGRPVRMNLQVGRWRCRNLGCKRQIFCQRLASVTGKHAQETNRFGEVVQSVAYALGGRPGERLSAQLGLPVSDDTLLRRIKQRMNLRPATAGISVVGVDEWAWRKGYRRYGTIVVDLQKGTVADLLPECTIPAQWNNGCGSTQE